MEARVQDMFYIPRPWKRWESVKVHLQKLTIRIGLVKLRAGQDHERERSPYNITIGTLNDCVRNRGLYFSDSRSGSLIFLGYHLSMLLLCRSITIDSLLEIIHLLNKIFLASSQEHNSHYTSLRCSGTKASQGGKLIILVVVEVVLELLDVLEAESMYHRGKWEMNTSFLQSRWPYIVHMPEEW